MEGTLDENPLQNDFYQSSYTFRGEAPTAQKNLNDLRFVNTGNLKKVIMILQIIF